MFYPDCHLPIFSSFSKWPILNLTYPMFLVNTISHRTFPNLSSWNSTNIDFKSVDPYTCSSLQYAAIQEHHILSLMCIVYAFNCLNLPLGIEFPMHAHFLLHVRFCKFALKPMKIWKLTFMGKFPEGFHFTSILHFWTQKTGVERKQKQHITVNVSDKTLEAKQQWNCCCQMIAIHSIVSQTQAAS